MAQHDFNIANQTAPSFRSDLNDALEAGVTNSSGSTEPSTLFGYMFWYDTSNNILKLNLSGTFVPIGKFDTVGNTFLPYIGSTQVTALLDEDNMASNSATAVPTQQSVKAYVDNNGFGVGQTWQDLSGSRQGSSISYQNTTGKPIMVNIHSDQSIGIAQVSSDNVTFVDVAKAIDTSNDATTISFVVPSNHYYRLTGSFPVAIWAELR